MIFDKNLIVMLTARLCYKEIEKHNTVYIEIIKCANQALCFVSFNINEEGVKRQLEGNPISSIGLRQDTIQVKSEIFFNYSESVLNVNIMGFDNDKII